MYHTHKSILLSFITLTIITSFFLLHPTAQSLSFHQFADTKPVWSIANFANVVSNIPFLIIGSIGIILVNRSAVPASIRTMYTVLFTGVILTGLGSAYYHTNPNNYTLLWDRVPMTIIFMSLLSATIAEMISDRLGIRLLIPLVLIGIASVLWWEFTEFQGHGDLRLYMLVQFYPMLALPLIVWLYYDPIHKPILKPLVWIVVWYVIAKIFEHWDKSFYLSLGISGHTLKHLAAAMSTWYFVVLFKQKYKGSISNLHD